MPRSDATCLVPSEHAPECTCRYNGRNAVLKEVAVDEPTSQQLEAGRPPLPKEDMATLGLVNAHRAVLRRLEGVAGVAEARAVAEQAVADYERQVRAARRPETPEEAVGHLLWLTYAGQTHPTLRWDEVIGAEREAWVADGQMVLGFMRNVLGWAEQPSGKVRL